ncbi:MAG: sigma-54 dependent transcriptional regulator [Desulfobulbaceae bacterium]|nr:sigma-54 dependent transcriptional regulator [Desulfobulbaceae bacterium]
MANVLIVEDSDDLLFSLTRTVTKEGYSVLSASSAINALKIINKELIDLVFLDIGLPDRDGLSLIGELKSQCPDIDIVMLTGRNDARSAVQALKAGAVDYILKPFELIEFKKILHGCMRNRTADKKALLEKGKDPMEYIVGESKAIAMLRNDILTAGSVNAPVLVTGETGTGKELVAKAIHQLSKGAGGIFVKLDCGALAANVIESELFGYEKGAFTDAVKQKKGLVEMANGGTLFLDEIGNLPLSLQPVLLRLIEESTFRRVGGLRDINVKLRIIAATNVHLEEEVASGQFREDLYYRLNVINIKIPPLCERGDDLLFLARYFLVYFNGEMKRGIKGFTPESEKLLLLHNWPGNIRELKNCIERAVIYCRDEWLAPVHLSVPRPSTSSSQELLPLLTLKDMELKYISNVLQRVGNNKSKAARILNISRNTLKKKLADQ